MVYSPKGMPDLDMSGKQVSSFEFWPAWLMYLPVALQWLILSIYYRSITLPLIANPNLPLSGMVGAGKSDVFIGAKGNSLKAILNWFIYTKDETEIAVQIASIKELMLQKGLKYPLVCKPDVGCRGSGVKLISQDEELADYLNTFPKNAKIVIQKLSDYEPEAGIFYIRYPDDNSGKIISLALKYTPYVIGDGKSTLQQLISKDSRAGELSHLYLDRLKLDLNKVINQGQSYRLIFAASHSRGAIFRDGRQYITPQLTAAINKIMLDLPEFYYGRLDVKFADIETLQKGENIQIIEINSASSEPLHIWDRKASLFNAIGSLMSQYRILFKIGNINRQRGFKPPTISSLIKAWKYEKSLVEKHPMND